MIERHRFINLLFAALLILPSTYATPQARSVPSWLRGSNETNRRSKRDYQYDGNLPKAHLLGGHPQEIHPQDQYSPYVQPTQFHLPHIDQPNLDLSNFQPRRLQPLLQLPLLQLPHLHRKHHHRKHPHHPKIHRKEPHFPSIIRGDPPENPEDEFESEERPTSFTRLPPLREFDLSINIGK